MNGEGAGQPGRREAWGERFGKDLGKPYHKVTVENFEERHKTGFRPRPGEFDNPTKDEIEWYHKLAGGSALRK